MKKNLAKVKQYSVLYILLIIPVASLLIYYIYPMFLQVILSFKDYTILGGVWKSPWVGFKNFKAIFTTPEMKRIIVNTVRISVLRLLVEFLPPMLLAIFLFDLSSNIYRRISQSILYIPYFFSWTIVFFVAFALFSSDGLINVIMKEFTGQTTNYLIEERYFYPLLLGFSIWKNIGWNTIIYLAALTNINIELFEAAKLDGAGPLQRIRHITLPGIFPVIAFLLTMSLGRLTSNEGTEQILLFYSPATYSVGDTIGTWVVRKSLGEFNYSLGAAVSFLNATIGLILVLISNKLSSKYLGVGIW